MKRKIFLAMCFLCMACISTFAAKKVRIIYSPTDAELYVDGSLYSSTSPADVVVKGDFITVELRKGGFVTTEGLRIWKDDKRKTIEIAMIEDDWWAARTETDLANKDFTITISDKFLERANGDIKEAKDLAWKMLHQVLLNYFDEISTSDQLSGFIQTPWTYEVFPKAKLQVRTRVVVKESNVGGQLTYKVRMQCQVGNSNAPHNDQYFKDTDGFILQKFAPMIQEFQTRLQ